MSPKSKALEVFLPWQALLKQTAALLYKYPCFKGATGTHLVLSNAGNQYPSCSPGSLPLFLSERRDPSGPEDRLHEHHFRNSVTPAPITRPRVRRFQVPPGRRKDKRPCAQRKETARKSSYFCVRKSKSSTWRVFEFRKGAAPKTRWRSTDQRWQFHALISMSDEPVMIGRRCHRAIWGLMWSCSWRLKTA